jgi:GT2 family glycosyltransferase
VVFQRNPNDSRLEGAVRPVLTADTQSTACAKGWLAALMHDTWKSAADVGPDRLCFDTLHEPRVTAPGSPITSDAASGAGRVGVVIVNWNGGAHLRRCLAAIEGQLRRADRIVVVDNGSSDGSLDAVLPVCPAAEIVRAGDNLGFAAACNRGVAMLADCEWVALLNPDAFPEPAWLEALLAAAGCDPRAASFASRMLAAGNRDLIDGAGDGYHCAGIPFRRGHHERAAGRFLAGDEPFSACAAAALFRRAALTDVGGFDESFFCYLEDVDLGFRLRLAGHSCRYVPDAVALHVGSASAGAGSDFVVYYGQRNLIWVFLKNMPAPLLWLLLPAHLGANLLGLVRHALRGRARPAWRAKVDGLRGVPGVWRARRGSGVPHRISWTALARSLSWRLPLTVLYRRRAG